MAGGIIAGLRLAGEVFLLILAADFVGGLFHWAEDTLGDVTTPVWGPLFAAPNARHHSHTAEILKVPWLRGARFVAGAGLAIILALWLLDALSWQWLLFLLLAGFNDQAHRLEHTPSSAVPRVVHGLRRAHVLQTPRHHWQHHKPPHTSHYCVLTPWLNPILDRLRFWRGLEHIFVPIFGAPRRPDLR